MDEDLLRRATDKLIDRVDRKLAEIGEFGTLESGEAKVLLGNAGAAIATIIEAYGGRLDSADRLMLIRRLNRLAGVFDTTVSQKYYGSFKAVLEASDGEHLANALKSAMGDIIGTHVMFYSTSYGQSSFLKVFFERAIHVINRCKKEISDGSDNRDLAIYTLCNLTETLAFAPEDFKKEATSLLARTLETIEDLPWGELATKLRSYVLSLLIRFAKMSNEREKQARKLLNQIADCSPMSLTDDQRSWILINLWQLHHERCSRFGSSLSIGREFPARSLGAFVRAGHCFQSSKSDDSISLHIRPEGEPIDPDQIIRILFPKYGLDSEMVSADELARLASWDDAKIRQTIASIIDANRTLGNSTRQRALSEAQKPHTGSEISDMDIPLTLGSLPLTVSIIVKSGQEIKGLSVPEQVWYQVTRPLEYLDHVCSLFFSAKPCSVPLGNRFKLARDHNLAIRSIAGDECVRLLRSHGHLETVH